MAAQSSIHTIPQHCVVNKNTFLMLLSTTLFSHRSPAVTT